MGASIYPGAALLTTTLVTLVLRLPSGASGTTADCPGSTVWAHHDCHRCAVVAARFRSSCAGGTAQPVPPARLPAGVARGPSRQLTMYTCSPCRFQTFLIERGGWSSGASGILLTAMSLQMIVFAPLGGSLADHRGWRNPRRSRLGAARCWRCRWCRSTQAGLGDLSLPTRRDRRRSRAFVSTHPVAAVYAAPSNVARLPDCSRRRRTSVAFLAPPAWPRSWATARPIPATSDCCMSL